jgi:PknH-like extracellular domain
VELVAQLRSVAIADEFIDKQTTAWEGCAAEVITTKEKVGTSITQDRVTAVRTGSHTVIASTVPLSRGMPCQHVLQVVSNFVLEASACGNNVSDHCPSDRVEARRQSRIGIVPTTAAVSHATRLAAQQVRACRG